MRRLRFRFRLRYGHFSIKLRSRCVMVHVSTASYLILKNNNKLIWQNFFKVSYDFWVIVVTPKNNLFILNLNEVLFNTEKRRKN